MKKKAFTLAEVLITLAIIGVVAAISIPSVISNTQQQEFKTGLRKAVSVLNSAITMNMAIDGESPYDNANTFEYLQRHMSIMRSDHMQYVYKFLDSSGQQKSAGYNSVFYTTDGMRFEAEDSCGRDCKQVGPKLHESNIKTCMLTTGANDFAAGFACGGCGSYGLKSNTNNTTKVPCLIMVDVNGDRKPSPPNAMCNKISDPCYEKNIIRYPAPDSKRLSDIFAIMITEKEAIPFGVVSQRAMYQAQAKK